MRTISISVLERRPEVLADSQSDLDIYFVPRSRTSHVIGLGNGAPAFVLAFACGINMSA